LILNAKISNIDFHKKYTDPIKIEYNETVRSLTELPLALSENSEGNLMVHFVIPKNERENENNPYNFVKAGIRKLNEYTTEKLKFSEISMSGEDNLPSIN
jgi:hypothetical protein